MRPRIYFFDGMFSFQDLWKEVTKMPKWQVSEVTQNNELIISNNKA